MDLSYASIPNSEGKMVKNYRETFQDCKLEDPTKGLDHTFMPKQGKMDRLFMVMNAHVDPPQVTKSEEKGKYPMYSSTSTIQEFGLASSGEIPVDRNTTVITPCELLSEVFFQGRNQVKF